MRNFWECPCVLFYPLELNKVNTDHATSHGPQWLLGTNHCLFIEDFLLCNKEYCFVSDL